eukprot:187074-Chlamydomonas_euryale.AAC.6
MMNPAMRLFQVSNPAVRISTSNFQPLAHLTLPNYPAAHMLQPRATHIVKPRNQPCACPLATAWPCARVFSSQLCRNVHAPLPSPPSAQVQKRASSLGAAGPSAEGSPKEAAQPPECGGSDHAAGSKGAAGRGAAAAGAAAPPPSGSSQCGGGGKGGKGGGDQPWAELSEVAEYLAGA